jgi:hypothetical protein
MGFFPMAFQSNMRLVAAMKLLALAARGPGTRPGIVCLPMFLVSLWYSEC